MQRLSDTVLGEKKQLRKYYGIMTSGRENPTKQTSTCMPHTHQSIKALLLGGE